MPAKNPRVNVVLEKPLYSIVCRSAQRDGVSISTKVRDLVREAIESYEDFAYAQMAEAREAHFDWKKGLTLEQVFGKRKSKKKS